MPPEPRSASHQEQPHADGATGTSPAQPPSPFCSYRSDPFPQGTTPWRSQELPGASQSSGWAPRAEPSLWGGLTRGGTGARMESTSVCSSRARAPSGLSPALPGAHQRQMGQGMRENPVWHKFPTLSSPTAPSAAPNGSGGLGLDLAPQLSKGGAPLGQRGAVTPTGTQGAA